jgi:hypothetical protein
VLGAGVVVSVAGKFWCGFYCCFFLVSVPAFCCCKFFALGGFGSVALVLQLPSVCILSIVFPLVCLIPWWMFQIKVFVVYKKKIKKISV